METVKRINISIFPPGTPKDVVLTTNGVILDDICFKCTTDEDDVSGSYLLDADFLIDEFGKWNNIQEESIIKARLDYGYEIFEIASKRVNQRDINIVARQITIPRTLNAWLRDVRPTGTSGQGAASHMLTNAECKHKDITITSDIATTGTAYYLDIKLYDALHTVDNCFETVWGGEITRRQYNLSINKTKGTNRGVVLRRAKNLLGFEGNTNIDKICTRIVAKGFNGIDAGVYIDSPLINQYNNVYTKEIRYEDVKVKTENDDEGFETLAEAQKELIRLAKLEFSENKIDELKGDYRINFIQLEQTEEYKQFIAAERVFVGDTITVIEDKLGIEIIVRAIRRKYNVLTQRTIETELSNTPIKQKKASSVSSIINDIKNQLDGNSIADYIQSMINSGATDSYVLYRQNEVLAMDTKDINTSTTVARFNKHGLAFSQTGYYGQYTYGFTIDGAFNASLISVGILTTVLIRNMDNSFEIDLSGSGGALFRNNGKDALRIESNQLKLYSWFENGDYIGGLGSLRDWINNNTKPIPVISLFNDMDSIISIGYETGSNTVPTYIEFDKYNVRERAGVDISPIIFFEQPLFAKGLRVVNESIIYDKMNFLARPYLNYGLQLVDNAGINLVNDQFIGRYNTEGGVQVRAAGKRFSVINDGQWTFQLLETSNSSTYRAQFWYSTMVDGNFHANGNITCNGSKTRVVKTENYEEVKLNAFETADCLFSDFGAGVINEEGECICYIDPVFNETVNTSQKYRVFLEAYDEGNKFDDIKLKVIKKTSEYFIVKSNCIGLEFDWNIVCKQKGYESDRLRNHKTDNSLDVVKRPTESYSEESDIELVNNNYSTENIDKILEDETKTLDAVDLLNIDILESDKIFKKLNLDLEGKKYE